MKKILAILLLLLIISATAVGCSSRKGAGGTETDLPGTESTPSSNESENATATEAARNNAEIRAGDVHIIQFDDPDPGDKIAVLTTTEGEIRIRLFARQAPKTVDAFVKLVQAGHYNGQEFHTVINGYKIEEVGAPGDEKFPKQGEFSLDLWNFRGAVALTGNDSDFMIVQASQPLNSEEEMKALNFPQKVIDKYLEVGGAPHQDWKNPVFGQVFEGMEVVDRIASIKADDSGTPEEPIIITEVRIETA